MSLESKKPLVHLRLALEDGGRRGLVPATAAAAVIAELEEMWYGDRTLTCVVARLGALAPGCRAAELLADLDRYRIKALDLIDFVETRPWR